MKALRIFSALSLCAFLSMGTTLAQDEEKEKRTFGFQSEFGAGFGAPISTVPDTFSSESLFAVVDVYGIRLPVEGGSTGVSTELFFGAESGINAEGIFESVSYTFWLLNRADVPGTNGKLFGGMDMKFGQGGETGYNSAFDLRFMLGLTLVQVGSVNLALEFYGLQEDVITGGEEPIAFALKARF